jgi:hypothetical protein
MKYKRICILIKKSRRKRTKRKRYTKTKKMKIMSKRMIKME